MANDEFSILEDAFHDIVDALSETDPVSFMHLQLELSKAVTAAPGETIEKFMQLLHPGEQQLHRDLLTSFEAYQQKMLKAIMARLKKVVSP